MLLSITATKSAGNSLGIKYEAGGEPPPAAGTEKCKTDACENIHQENIHCGDQSCPDESAEYPMPHLLVGTIYIVVIAGHKSKWPVESRKGMIWQALSGQNSGKWPE